MQRFKIGYFQNIVIHIFIGILIFLIPFLAKIYSFLILVLGAYFVIKYRNKNDEVLFVCAYITGVEVFLRMTHGNPNYEFSKYGVIAFILLGMYYSGFSKKAVPYWIYIILLVPGVIIGTQTLNLDTLDIRKTISFNISGPLCLGISSLYCYYRKIDYKVMNNLLLYIGLPIISMTIYVFLFTPDLKTILVSTASNAQTSGGFGANQVSTIFGLGMFVFFSRAFLVSPNRKYFIVNIFIGLVMAYRGLITFSRGGMITGMVMLMVLLLVIYVHSKNNGKFKLLVMVLIFSVIVVGIWSYTEIQTGGLITKRYTNRDALGRIKQDKFSGREEIVEQEIKIFLDNPFFGVGVAKAAEIRAEETGIVGLPSHNEITRLLAEHGSLGLAILFILIFTPMILYLGNKQNIYVFCFLAFWFLSLNHAAMRTASPSFVYALSLLNVFIKREPND